MHAVKCIFNATCLLNMLEMKIKFVIRIRLITLTEQLKSFTQRMSLVGKLLTHH